MVVQGRKGERSPSAGLQERLIPAGRRDAQEGGFSGCVLIHRSWSGGVCVCQEALEQTAALPFNVHLFQGEVGRAGAYSNW